MKMNIKNISQFSPIRSGSTLVYNILREFFNVKKSHNISIKDNNYYVITYRHPYNSIISSLLRNNKIINVSNINDEVKEYLKNGGNDLLKNDLLKKNVLLLKYEQFFNDYNVIYDELEGFLNIKIHESKRLQITKKYNVNSVKEIIKKYKTFAEYDKKTHLHGKHISKYNGETNYKELLSDKEINVLKENETLNKIIEKFNYTI